MVFRIGLLMFGCRFVVEYPLPFLRVNVESPQIAENSMGCVSLSSSKQVDVVAGGLKNATVPACRHVLQAGPTIPDVPAAFAWWLIVGGFSHPCGSETMSDI